MMVEGGVEEVEVEMVYEARIRWYVRPDIRLRLVYKLVVLPPLDRVDHCSQYRWIPLG